MRRVPKYVHSFTDRHGKQRYYFRRPGFERAPLPGLPWSPQFMAAYEAALAGQAPKVGSTHVKAGTIRALAISYFNSSGFRSLAPSTQSTYRNIIERFCRQADKIGKAYGDKSVAALRRENVVKLMASCDTPHSANGLRKALRALMKHAVELGWRVDDPTLEVKAARVKSDGYHSWTDDEIAQFEKRHPLGTKGRLAMDLLLYTGQRRSDVVRMGRQHVRDGWLNLKQCKTGVELAIPVLPQLALSIEASANDHLTFLTTEFGRPFTAAGFGNWFRKQCNSAGLHGCSAHGLRKAAARVLAEAGCTAHEIGAITGHTSLREIVRYTMAAEQKKLAASAMAKFKAGTSNGKPLPWLAKGGEK
jgi:integrase